MTIFDMPLISHELHISDSPLRCQLPGLIGGFHFLTTSYDRQALVLAGMTATDLFSATRIPNQRFVIATLQDFLTGGLKGSFLPLHIISGDSLNGKVFSLVRILLDGVIVK
jgi:hypothetical protein